MEEDPVPNIEDDEDDDEEWAAPDDDDEELGWLQEELVSRERPAERSGHITVTDRSCLFVWGGYKNADTEAAVFTDLYLPKNEVWIYNMETGRWRMQRSEGEGPSSMSGSCGSCVDGILYLFGGHQARGNTNLVYRLPLRASALRWEKMSELTGLAPTCKDKLGCWVYRNQLAYFGGYGYIAQPGHRGTFALDENSFMGNHAGRGWNNHIHVLDLETAAWSQPITKGDAPSPRAAHACATVANRGYVFGGRYMDQRLNDLFCIDLDSWEWSEMSVPQHGPAGRSWHSFTPVSADHIFVFGGFTTGRETLSDAWLYRVSTSEWRPLQHQHTERPRLWHTACLGPDGEVFVFGGCANDLLSQQQAILFLGWVLDPSSSPLHLLKNLKRLNKRKAHSNELLVFSVQPKPLVRLCLDAAVRHRKRLELMWDVLPKALLVRLRHRAAGDRHTRRNPTL